jgi:hypothetical protein
MPIKPQAAIKIWALNVSIETTHIFKNYWVERKVFAFSKNDVSKPRSFYKAGIEKLVARWETVIASNGNYIID